MSCPFSRHSFTPSIELQGLRNKWLNTSRAFDWHNYKKSLEEVKNVLRLCFVFISNKNHKPAFLDCCKAPDKTIKWCCVTFFVVSQAIMRKWAFFSSGSPVSCFDEDLPLQSLLNFITLLIEFFAIINFHLSVSQDYTTVLLLLLP